MEKVQDPVSKPRLASVQVDKHKDMTSSDKFTKITHSTLTQIPTSGTRNIPTGISTMLFEKYLLEEYHHRGQNPRLIKIR